MSATKQTEHQFEYLYKCSWFQTTRHKYPYKSISFAKPEHTWWIYETPEWFDGLVKVKYIRECPCLQHYQMALLNSALEDEDPEKSSQNQICYYCNNN